MSTKAWVIPSLRSSSRSKWKSPSNPSVFRKATSSPYIAVTLKSIEAFSGFGPGNGPTRLWIAPPGPKEKGGQARSLHSVRPSWLSFSPSSELKKAPGEMSLLSLSE